MAEHALVVNTARILMARLIKNDNIEGITHCALGDGDATFTNPADPPEPTTDQALLKNESIRKRAYHTAFLAEDPGGNITVDGTTYAETTTETDIIGVFFRFDDNEATASVIKEIGFFGGTVQYIASITGDTAKNGIYDETENPDGEVLSPGYLYEVRNIPDYSKDDQTMLELIAIVRMTAVPAP